MKTPVDSVLIIHSQHPSSTKPQKVFVSETCTKDYLLYLRAVIGAVVTNEASGRVIESDIVLRPEWVRREQPQHIEQDRRHHRQAWKWETRAHGGLTMQWQISTISITGAGFVKSLCRRDDSLKHHHGRNNNESEAWSFCKGHCAVLTQCDGLVVWIWMEYLIAIHQKMQI